MRKIRSIRDLRGAGSYKGKYAMPSRKIWPVLSVALVVILISGCILCTQYWNHADVYVSEYESFPDEQNENISDRNPEYQLSQTYDGYTMELQSVVCKSTLIQLTFRLTAPENVDISAVFAPDSKEWIAFQEIAVLLANSNSPENLTYELVDDGDGKNNTLNVVITILPTVYQAEELASGRGETCEIEFTGIVSWGYDRKYEHELLLEKYPEKQDYILTPEESNRVHPQTLLVSGNWKFEVKLPKIEIENTELLSAPISTEVMVVRIGASEYKTVETVENVKLTSIQLSASGVTVAFEKPEPIEKFDCIYVNVAQFSAAPYVDASEDEAVFLMKKDGTRIDFFQSLGAKETAFLQAESTIVPAEVDYLQMSDGTKIFMPKL